MKKIVLFVLTVINVLYFSKAEEYFGKAAEQLVKNAALVRTDKNHNIPVYIKFKSGYEIDISQFDNWFTETFQPENNISFQQVGWEKDNLGFIHYRYRQLYEGVQLRDANFILHTLDGKISSLNGKLFTKIQSVNTINLTIDQARENALANIKAEKYKWESAQEEVFLKKVSGNPEATYYPAGKKVLIPQNDYKTWIYAYRFSIYAAKPLSYADYFINCETGAVELILDRLHFADEPGVAETKYSGTQNIIADSYSGTYRLREAGRGDGIETYNMQTGTDYGSAVDFTDDDNYWNNVNAQYDEAATDAHWGAEMTYDYYFTMHNRNSIDNNGMKLLSYIHFDVNYSNAFWDGQSMTYGDGEGSPFCVLDVCSHEFTHGVTEYTANLNYTTDESGALNEGFSDIFGVSVEFFAKPSQANWTMGEDLGFFIRDIANPNATENPDTYLGDYWDSFGEQHQNSTVISHWFYLVSEGGSGTNDNGDAYTVNSIGMNKAETITYRTLSVYLTNTSDYADTRFYSIISAIDLFGACSPEVETVTNAWFAVGVGNAYVPYVFSDFTADFTTNCSPPAIINFQNQSINGMSFYWDFGDGTTSTVISPTHSYSSFGNFDVTLIADGGTCGIDTIIKADFISINTANPCIAIMPSSGNLTISDCSGILYDSGGNDNYQDMTNSVTTIAPVSANQIILTFIMFDYEQDWDSLFIYDGPDIYSPLIGGYTGVSLPNGGTIISTAGQITLRQFTDQAVTRPGFIANWQCIYPESPPVANFQADVQSTCTGQVNFTDLSINGPSQWLWNFGDGDTSALQHPIHIYSSSGSYTVMLLATNIYGSDTLQIIDYISVNLPDNPVVVGDTSCGAGSAILSASGSGELLWYDSPSDGNLIYTGTVFNTPFLDTTTIYYVSNNITYSVQYTGKPDNSGGGGYFGNPSYIHYLVFDCFTPMTLISVKVYAGGAGNRQIALRDSSFNIIQYLDVYVPDGESRVTLNFNIPVADNLQLVGLESPNLYRNNAGVSYPYEIPGQISIKWSSASTNPYNYYYYFYDWEVQAESCISQCVPVTATIISIQSNFTEDTIFTSQPDTIILSPGAGFDSYLWQDGSTDEYFSVSSFGWYYVTITENGCILTDSLFVDYPVKIVKLSDNESPIKVFPNPFRNILYISFYIQNQIESDIFIEISNIHGQNIYSKYYPKISEFPGSVNLSDVATGMYLLNIRTKQKNQIMKIIVDL
ncbi:MAG: M4 family metallopeptidase [Bacteroidia bacterium]|nr:M4 family metallopeptidase [Bacteroidia bacterium]